MMFRALTLSALLSLLGCFEENLYMPWTENPSSVTDSDKPSVISVNFNIECSQPTCIFSDNVLRWYSARDSPVVDGKWIRDSKVSAVPAFTSKITTASNVPLSFNSEMLFLELPTRDQACVKMEFTNKSDNDAPTPSINIYEEDSQRPKPTPLMKSLVKKIKYRPNVYIGIEISFVPQKEQINKSVKIELTKLSISSEPSEECK